MKRLAIAALAGSVLAAPAQAGDRKPVASTYVAERPDSSVPGDYGTGYSVMILRDPRQVRSNRDAQSRIRAVPSKRQPRR